jgi:hypothetical protein
MSCFPSGRSGLSDDSPANFSIPKRSPLRDGFPILRADVPVSSEQVKKPLSFSSYLSLLSHSSSDRSGHQPPEKSLDSQEPLSVPSDLCWCTKTITEKQIVH